MSTSERRGWKQLIAGHPWFEGEGHFPLPAYSEFMPPPRLGLTPYGAADELFSEDDPYAWSVSEIEQLYELDPGLENVAHQVLGQLVDLGTGGPAHHISGHARRNLKDNPYWPPELAARAGHLDHERYVTLLPLALARSQDDMGRVRWTLFGGSEQGPERAFWKSFYSAPGVELPEKQALAFFARLLHQVYGEQADGVTQLAHAGLRIFPSPANPDFPYWNVETLPAWTKHFAVRDGSSFAGTKYLLTFAPFNSLPAEAKERYLAGHLHLLPFPGSLVFWGMSPYLRLQKQLPCALQLPLQRVVARHGGAQGLRVPQSGWLHEPGCDGQENRVQAELLLNTYRRTSRWNRVPRYADPAAESKQVDKVTSVLFSTSLQALDLYNKPMARNAQLWTEEAELLLDGPMASRQDISKAAAKLMQGGMFRYRFQFPAMNVGTYQVYWHRPLVAFRSPRTGQFELIADAPLGYLTAYPAEAPDLAHPIELFPRLLRRDIYLSALQHFETERDHYAHQTALNLIELLDVWRGLGEQPLPKSFVRHMLRVAKDMSLDEWLDDLPKHSALPAAAQSVTKAVQSFLRADDPLPEPLTYGATATRAYEEAYWNDILTLSNGRYETKDNADVVDDPPTLALVEHHRRDLEQLGDYLIERHTKAIADAGMEGKAMVGDLPFRWRTDFDFALFGGWRINQEGHDRERDILVIIPGKNRQEAMVLADHYDTAYEEDVFDKSRGGSGARIAAKGADDNYSATATLLHAAPVYLRLAREGKLERDVWLLHLTGEEFPSDCMGARHFCQALVEKTLKLRVAENKFHDLSSVRITGVFVMDMIAHNRDNAQDIFQISPGKSRESLRIAYQAHIANMLWNEKTRAWNQSEERKGKGRGKRTTNNVLPDIARHLELHGQIRTNDDPESSLYNTDGQIFSDIGAPVVLLMENYDINRTGYHDTKDTMDNIDLDYGAALSAIAIETVARVATLEKV